MTKLLKLKEKKNQKLYFKIKAIFSSCLVLYILVEIFLENEKLKANKIKLIFIKEKKTKQNKQSYNKEKLRKMKVF